MPASRPESVVDFHLIGQVDYDAALRLQRRMMYEASTASKPRITVLLCEHPQLISVGRKGSRAHIRFSSAELEREHLKVRWVHRGGGCILHAPGQLAIYPIANLQQCEWTVGEFLSRFQGALRDVLDDMQIQTTIYEGSAGVWGRTGLLVAMGMAVQNQVTSHGAYLNVNPAMQRFGFIDTAAPTVIPDENATRSASVRTTMSCLLAERRQPARMSNVRSAIVNQLTAAWQADRYHVHSGHPWLLSAGREKVARAS